MHPGITLPVLETLSALPVKSAAGCVLTALYNITLKEYTYIYGLFPTSNTVATFWRYSITFNTWEQMASPSFDATDLLTTACAMVAEPTNGRVVLFNSRNDTVTPNYHRFQAYNPTNNAWAEPMPAAPNNLETVATLVAPWASDAALCRPCRYLGFPASDNFVYLTGNADTRMYAYDLVGNTWAANVGAARSAVNGTGVGAVWLPEAPDLIFTPRGNSTASIDVYTISTGAFANGPTQIPAILRTTGTEVTADIHRNRFLTQHGGRVFEAPVIYETTGGRPGYLNTHTPLGTFGTDGTLHKGNSLCAVTIGSQSYVYWRQHTSNEFLRFNVVE